MRDRRIVAVGNTLFHSKSWKVFPDFLSDYLKTLLGADWGNSEIAKPFEDRHLILQWYDSYCRVQRSHTKQNGGVYSAKPTGVVYCYWGLAYDLYLLKHNVELQERFIRRVKDIKNFQGAYYELIVAHCLIRAGVELTLEDETDESSKHCEFSAISKLTRKRYWVEAKMRSVSGILGKTDLDGITGRDPTSMLSRHLRDALRKPAADERLIFIDVNAPPSNETEMPSWIQAAVRRLDNREKDLQPGQEAYVVVTNTPFHRSLNDERIGRWVLAYGLGIPDFSKPGEFRLTEIYKRKQKHIDAHNIAESFNPYPNIPTTFDGSLPSETLKDDARPIKIGETYFFDDIGDHGLVGEVTTATVSEREKEIWIGVLTEEGKGIIIKKEITEDELADYKAHPDAYFGVVQPAGKKIEDPVEFFEWMVDAYKNTTREKLLEFCKNAQDYSSLQQLSREELVLEICERWTGSMVESARTKENTPT